MGSYYVDISMLQDIVDFSTYSSTSIEGSVKYENYNFKLSTTGYASDGYAIIYAR